MTDPPTLDQLPLSSAGFPEEVSVPPCELQSTGLSVCICSVVIYVKFVTFRGRSADTLGGRGLNPACDASLVWEKDLTTTEPCFVWTRLMLPVGVQGFCRGSALKEEDGDFPCGLADMLLPPDIRGVLDRLKAAGDNGGERLLPERVWILPQPAATGSAWIASFEPLDTLCSVFDDLLRCLINIFSRWTIPENTGRLRLS